jgi:sodium/proline symporter
MTDASATMYSFLAFMAVFLLIGLMAVRRARKTADDYLLASREISPFFVGLSGAASTASGFGFTGMIGFGYMMGLPGAWFIFGIIFGSLIAFALTTRRFRTLSQRCKSSCYTEFLAAGIPGGRKYLLPVLGLISIAAVTLYGTAQLTAGGKALHVLFGWDYNAGAIMGAFIVLLYCWAGGIRASIWTDVAQIVVMFAAMALLAGAGLAQIGGLGELVAGLRAIDPKLADLLPAGNPFGPFLFILGCLSVGVSFIGFPHVMVRFMTLEKPKQTRQAVMWFEISYAAFYIAAYLVALCARVIIPDVTQLDTELTLPKLAMELLNPLLVGVILAGIFASTISTADSLILSGTASLSRDIFTKYRDSYAFMKVSTLSLTALALGIALSGNQSVFDLVLFVIAIMGAGFAPLLLVRVMRWPVSGPLALFMTGAGLAAAVWWRYMGYHKHIFDSLPGMAAALLAYGLGYLVIKIAGNLRKTHEKLAV